MFQLPLLSRLVTPSFGTGHAQEDHDVHDAPGDRWVLALGGDSALLARVHDALVAEGVDVVTASGGTIALDLLWSVGHDQPDLIVLDVDLPELGGATFARLYAKIPVPHAPILVCSAGLDGAARAARIQAAGLLRKPFDVGELVTTVSHIIDAQRAA